MKQIVFLKQVPVSAKVSMDPVTHTLIRSGNKGRMNPYDLHALYAAVKIKESTGGEIIAITMGPPQAETVLREAGMLGADKGILLSDPSFAGSDTWSTGYILSKAVEWLGGADILHAGKQAVDGDTGQVGPGIAARLNIPQITDVVYIHGVTKRKIYLDKLTDTHSLKLESSFPVLLTYGKEMKGDLLPTLAGYERSLQMKIRKLTAGDLSIDSVFTGLTGSPTRVVETYLPGNKKDFRQITDLTQMSHIILDIITLK